ncbi:transporter [Chitinibacter sp. SCUT-21]|uniref:transporter n=1 Tax=Chitinibacter sp. SCUT-21 TaxID=2970891 RepID=UPI0035A72DFA
MRIPVLAFSFLLLSASAAATDPRSYTVNADDVARTSVRYRVQETEAPRGPKEIEHRTRQSYSIRHVQYFGLAGQLAYAGLSVPYHRIEQDFSNSRRKGDDQDGLGDPMLAFGMGLYRTPALSREALRSYNDDGLSSGCQLHISVPLGSYQEMRASNPGANRWMVIPECQLGWNQGNWLFEGLASVNWFSDNDEYRGTTFSQENQYNLKLIGSYGSQRSMYGGLTLEYHNGGETIRAGRADDNKLDNWVGGAMVYFKIDGLTNVKLIGEVPLKTAKGAPETSEFSVVLSHNW